MRKGIALMVALFCMSMAAFAQDATEQKGSPATGNPVTLKGYVVDAMCAGGIVKKGNVMTKAASHTKECALEDACAAAGFGLFSEGKWYKFDAHGDELAHSLVANSEKEKGISVEVTGKLVGKDLAVSSIEEAPLTETKHDVKSGAVDERP